MSLGTQEQRTEGMKKQAQELIDQAYTRGYKKAEEDYYIQTEKDRESSYQLGIEVGRNEAWETARKLVFMGYRNCNEILGDGVLEIETLNDIFNRCTASEAISKIKDYEQKKQEKDEIKVGDEVECKCPFLVKCVVVAVYPNQDLDITIMRKDGYCLSLSSENVKKTGRHFDAITEVLKKMREGDADEA